MSKYRDEEISFYTYAEIVEDCIFEDDEEFVKDDDFKSIIDSIESDVKDIESILEPISGLDEIEDAKEKIKKLLEDLY